MKRFLLLTLAVCLMISSSVVWAGPKKGAKSDDFVFRRVKWGMTMEQVKASENRPDGLAFISENPPNLDNGEKGPSLLYQTDNILDSPKTTVSYEFEQGKLKYVTLRIYRPIMRTSVPESGFKYVVGLLATKYGLPYAQEDESMEWLRPEKRVATWLFSTGSSKPEETFVVITYGPPSQKINEWYMPELYKDYLDDF